MGMRERNMKIVAKHVQRAHHLCILFSDNGDDLLDDSDLNIGDDELHGRTDGNSC